MKRIGMTLISLLFSMTFAQADTIYYSSCRGGGGVPLVDITPEFKLQKDLVHTSGLATDFFYWQRKNQLVYENEERELRIHDITRHTDIALTNAMEGKLARFADPSEQFILTAGRGWLLDLAQGFQWHEISPDRVEPLFSSEGALYGLEAPSQNDEVLNFVRYEAGETDRFSCELPAVSNTSAFHLGTGHVFPYVFLYQTTELGDGTQQLSLYNLEIKRRLFQKYGCKLEPLKTYAMAMPAPVTAVYRFSDLEYAVRLADPSRQILWDTPNDCTYFNFGGRDALIPNTHQPMIVTWMHGEGMGITFLNAKKRTQLLQPETLDQVAQQDLWLSDDGKKLFVGEKPADHMGRMIYDVNLLTAVK